MGGDEWTYTYGVGWYEPRLTRTPGVRLASDFLESGRTYVFVGPNGFVSDEGVLRGAGCSWG